MGPLGALSTSDVNDVNDDHLPEYRAEGSRQHNVEWRGYQPTAEVR